MTRLDGKMTAGELDVAFLPAGDRPDRYDLGRLRKILGARLAAAKALHDTQKKA